MTRRLYGWLILLHPPEFRRRFGEQMLCIFEEAGEASARALCVDGLISLMRQWALRSGCWKWVAAFVGALAQIVLVAYWWLAAIHGMVVANSPPGAGMGKSLPNGLLLLLIAGVLTGVLMGLTVLAVWIGRFSMRRICRAGVRRHVTLALSVAMALVIVPSMWGQAPPARPEFEVSSVKPNITGCPNGRGGGRGAPQPGRLSVLCTPLLNLIQAAYGTFANGPNPDPRLLQVLGAPGWVESDPYDVEAKPAGAATMDQIYGPMLQVLLEDRFRLKIHRETREVPVYALTVAKSGVKPQALKDSNCTPVDLNKPPAQLAPGQPPPSFCGRASMRQNDGKMTVDVFGLSMSSFAGVTLSSRLSVGRPVIDKTGLSGVFDFHLEFAPDNSSGGPAPPGDSIFTALQDQLGLKLSPGKGPVDVLVVDHVERPSAN